MIAAETSMPAPRRILLADANDADIERYKDYLSDLNCDIQTAIDGTATLDHVRHFHPHLILLGPRLTDINGFEVCKRIKDNPSTRRTVIMMVTALSELGDIERAVEAGTDDFLSEPVSKTELLRRVENLLRLQDHLE